MTIIKDGNMLNGVRYFNTIALTSGASVNSIVTTIGVSGTDTAIATEKAVRDAIAAGSGNTMFKENDQTISSDYTVLATKNASTVGPVAIASGTTVTVQTNGTWVIL